VFLTASGRTSSKTLVYFQRAQLCLEINRKSGELFLVGVKTTIHLFTYSPFWTPLTLGLTVQGLSINNQQSASVPTVWK